MKQDDAFELFDLEVVVEKIEGHCTCNMGVGDRFYLRSGKLSLPGRTRLNSSPATAPAARLAWNDPHLKLSLPGAGPLICAAMLPGYKPAQG